jgi:hypothetical protein
MRVRMKTTACGPTTNLKAGQVYDLPADQAEVYVRGRFAELVEEEQAAAPTSPAATSGFETATAPPAAERAVVEPPADVQPPAHPEPPVVEEEQATAPTSPAKKKGHRG